MKLALLLLLSACAKRADWVDEVRFVHGAPAHGVPGPWALSGYRIGAHAMRTFGITREQAFSVSVVHRAPASVQYTCMMDGLMAATGVSPGKMNIKHEPVSSEKELETLITYNGRTLRYRLVDTFKARIKTVDYAQFPDAADFVKALPDEQVLISVN